MKAKTVEEAIERDRVRFWSKVKIGKKQECWIWQGVRNKRTGRGSHNPAHFNGVPVLEGRATVQAHVWAFILHYGYRPLGHGLQRGSAGVILRHACANGHLGCVSPHHLKIGTQKENAAETAKAGRRTDQVLKRAMDELSERIIEMQRLKIENERLREKLKEISVNA